MKIVMVQRKSGSGFSLEAVYGAIVKEITEHNVEIFTLTEKWLFKDILKLRRCKADLFHITGDIHYLSFFLPLGKTILTIHDIGRYLRDLNGLRRFIYRMLWINLPIYFARAVFFSSLITKIRVSKIVNLDKKYNAVMKLCSNLVFDDEIQIKKNSKPKILVMGTAKHKNVSGVIKAVENIPCILLIVGELDNYLLNLLKESEVDYQNYVSIGKQELESLYLESDLLTFPSFHEGFGLPIIEAQASRTPLITSNISPMKEVAGEGAILVDPFQTQTIRSAIIEIISNIELIKELTKKGKENANLYSAKIVANDHVEKYKELTKN